MRLVDVRHRVDRVADDHLDPQLRLRSLDKYIIRAALLRAVNDFLPTMRGILLDVGCGDMPYRQLVLAECPHLSAYIGVDVPGDIYGTPDLFWDGSRLPLAADVADTAFATEVLEHCPHPDRLLSELMRVLRPGASVLITVPFLWPLHDVPFDEYRYTPFALERLLGNAGFEEIDIQPLGGWDASMAQMIGLWVRRRPMTPWKRAIASRLAVPLMRWLLIRDNLPSFRSSPMIIGLAATARKPANVFARRSAEGSIEAQ